MVKYLGYIGGGQGSNSMVDAFGILFVFFFFRFVALDMSSSSRDLKAL